MIEADRALVYLGFFLAAFLIAQTDRRRQRFAEGLAISLAIVALLAPGQPPAAARAGRRCLVRHRPRASRYPLGYWNANGAIFGIAAALLLWSSRHAAWTGLRWLSAALLPTVLLALYLTYSRGGLLTLAIAVLCTLALSRDRLWLLRHAGGRDGRGSAGRPRGAGAAQPCRQHRQPGGSRPGGDRPADPACGHRSGPLLFAGLRWTERREGRLDRPGARALPQSRPCCGASRRSPR